MSLQATVGPFSAAVEQAAAIAAGELTPSELAAAYLKRIERLNPALNAFWVTTPELAEVADGGDGRLAGVSVAIKDLVALEGVGYTRGSRAYEHDVADHDSFVVARLKQEGCRVIGKTTTSEFGGRPVTDHGLHGAARNPWNPDHTAGGSSGGAAVAVAAGLCSFAHGSDGGGSVRIPASCCGVVGLKPSRGLISMAPDYGHGWGGLLTDGVLARTVSDAAAGLDAMAGHVVTDPYWTDPAVDGYFAAVQRPPKALRIALDAGEAGGADPEVARAVRQIAALCESLGHHVVEGAPRNDGIVDPAYKVFATAIAAVPVADRSVIDPWLVLIAEFGESISAVEYVNAIDLIHSESRSILSFWSDCDVLITPTLPRPAPRIGELGADPESAGSDYLGFIQYTMPANSTGQPAISLPLATHSSGLPIGVQLVGAPRGDALILALAAQLEASRPWADRRPAGSE